MAKAEPVVLHSLLGIPNTKALKTGKSLAVRDIRLFRVKVANTQFKAMVREPNMISAARDGHLSAGEALRQTLCPASRYHRWPQPTSHDLLQCRQGLLSPSDLSGRRVGVRAYTQTTGACADSSPGLRRRYRSVRWIIFEDAHLAEYRDPSSERAPKARR
jgi:4,5-dihydroxyphthalate decarboxylase